MNSAYDKRGGLTLDIVDAWFEAKMTTTPMSSGARTGKLYARTKAGVVLEHRHRYFRFGPATAAHIKRVGRVNLAYWLDTHEDRAAAMLDAERNEA